MRVAQHPLNTSSFYEFIGTATFAWEGVRICPISYSHAPPAPCADVRDAPWCAAKARNGRCRFGSVGDNSGRSGPLGRAGSKQELANVALFLVSEAASYVNGQVISVDGGSGVDGLKMPMP